MTNLNNGVITEADEKEMKSRNRIQEANIFNFLY